MAAEEPLLSFPCDFPIKIMGASVPGYAQAVLAVVQRHAPDFDGATMEMRASRGGRYISVTCTIRATSRTQLDALYRAQLPSAGQSRALSAHTLTVRRLGRVDYPTTWRAMQDFTARRGEHTADELWLLEHPPVFTLGLAGKPEHLLADIGVPLIKTDRGGQITYHGPGQLVSYLLLDLRRRGFGVRELVRRLEQAVIELLGDAGIAASRSPGAPGVYVGGAKVAALGLRVRGGCSYHGLALNVDMDLAPFAAINPCGYPGLAVTQLKELGVGADLPTVAAALAAHLENQLGQEHG